LLAVRIGVERGEQCRTALYPHAYMETPPLVPELAPTQELPVGEAGLSFCDGSAANPAHHQLMPNLI
ncbi:hypothetical protein QK414_34400, partial [Pseudomonas aeruginosa]|nr:hypothetical protein [Pseudomonas aeruginosa]